MGVRWGRSDVRQSEGEDTQYDAVRGGREVGHVAAAFCAAWRCKNWPPVRSPFADGAAGSVFGEVYTAKADLPRSDWSGRDHRKLREAEIVLAQGGTVADACRRIGVTEQSYYRWCKEYGGLKMDQARRMKELERENALLKHLVAELSLDKAILTEAARGNF